MPSPGRARLAPALASALVFSSAAAPPEHLHEADAGHPRSVAHRHFEAHDRDGAEISHGAGRVVWFDDVGIEPATHEFSLVQAIAAVEVDTLPEPRGCIAISSIDAPPPHGP